jgi:ribulose-phosphate 3-epimerase
MPKIIPAILTKDIVDLEYKFKQLQGLTDWVQIDIMDGTLVPNTSISLEDIFTIGNAKDFSLEAHLMVSNPETYFPDCKKNNIQRVIFHVEALGDIKNTLVKAAAFSFEKGLALNPETPIDAIMPYIHTIDVVLLMSVHPGFQGQQFIMQTLDKVKELKKISPTLRIEVDGGINLDNIHMLSEAGADYLVVGSGLFEADNIQERFEELMSKMTS